MSESSKSMKLLDYLTDQSYSHAKELCYEATNEINTIENQFGKKFTENQRKAISNVRKIIQNLSDDQTRAATTAAKSTSQEFRQYIVVEYFKVDSMKPRGKPQQTDNFKTGQERFLKEGGDVNQPLHPRTQKAVLPIRENITSTTSTGLGVYEKSIQKPYQTTELNTEKRVKVGNFDRHHIDTSDEHSKNQASKRASEAMRINNADIADLSDTNRPTKIAEKFSELYDNEWTEAFESLSKQKRIKEQDIIEELLKIVEKAYRDCEAEAKRQIEKIRSEILAIIKGEPVTISKYKDASDDDEGKGLLILYRKGIADLAVQRLKDQFTTNVKQEYNADVKMVDYANKAVELAWWMVVQDPPVYMCPPSITKFDSNLYKAYTRSGTTPEYFVWPALKLHKHGGLLMKGVVQYKN